MLTISKKLFYAALILVALSSLFNCSAIIAERPLLNDKTSDEINISDAYWIVYADDSNEPGSAWKVEQSGFFNKSKIWVVNNDDEKVYIRAKKVDSRKDTYIAQCTFWDKGKPLTMIGYVTKNSSKEYVLYQISSAGVEMAKNSGVLKKLGDLYEIDDKGSSKSITFNSQAVELYSDEILKFIESLNINIDFKVVGKIKVSDEKTVKQFWNKKN